MNACTRKGSAGTRMLPMRVGQLRLRRRDGVVSAVLAVVAAVLAWSRLPADVRATVWAEDGQRLLAQRLELGPWASLVATLDGSQHFVPRVLTDVAVLLVPLNGYAEAVTALSCLVSGAVAGLTYLFTAGRITHVAPRLLLATVPVLLPLGPLEVSGNLANLHWYFLYLTPFALLYRPSRWWQAGVQAVAVFLAAVSEIQVVVFAPLLLLMPTHRRSWPAGLAFLAGSTAQVLQGVYTSLPDPRLPAEAAPTNPAQVAVGYVVHPVMGSWVPDYSRAATLLQEHPVLLGFLAMAPFAVAAAVALAASWSPRSTLVVVLAVGSVVLWTLALVVNPRDIIGSLGQPEGPVPVVGYLRYAAVPSMFLLALLALAVDRLLEIGSTVARLGGLALLALVLTVLVLGFDPAHTRRDPGPLWEESVAVARQECAKGAEDTQIRTAPEGWGPYVDCDVVLSQPGGLVSLPLAAAMLRDHGRSAQDLQCVRLLGAELRSRAGRKKAGSQVSLLPEPGAPPLPGAAHQRDRTPCHRTGRCDARRRTGVLHIPPPR